MKFEIIFDDGGGAVLQANGAEYVHSYDDMDQLAIDVMALVAGADVSTWDGHDLDAYIDDDSYWAAYRVGGYRALDHDTWRDDHTGNDWRNIRSFSAAVLRTRQPSKAPYA